MYTQYRKSQSAYTKGHDFANERLKQFHSMQSIWDAAQTEAVKRYKTLKSQKNFLLGIHELFIAVVNQ